MPYPLRMSVELRAQVTALAKANNRSVNTELVLLLQEGLSYRQPGAATGRTSAPEGHVPGIDVAALAAELAPQLAPMLAAALAGRVAQGGD